MSKITVFLIVVVIAAGLAAGFYIIPRIPIYQQNPSIILEDLKFIPTTIQNLPQLIMQNIGAVVGVVFTGISSLAYWGRKYSQGKETWETQINDAKNVINTQKTQIDQLKIESQNTISKQQTDFTDNIQTMSSKLVQTQDNLDAKIQEVKNLTEERNYFVKKAETAEDLVKKYEEKFGTLYVK